MSKFYKVFLSVLAAAAVLLAAGLVVLGFALADYEKNVPKTMAETYFDKYVKTCDFAGLAGIVTKSSFETDDAINTASRAAYGDKELTLLAASTSAEGSYGYIVKAGDERVLTFTLEKTGEKTGFGFLKYKLSEVKFAFAKTATVRAPSDCTVSINAKPLGAEYRKGDGVKDDTVTLPEGIEPAEYCTYVVPNLISDPVITAAGKDGSAHEVAYSKTTRQYEVRQAYSEELAGKYSDYVIEATKKYATYMEDDGYFGMITEYFEPGTATYNYIKDTIVSFVWDHDSYKFTDAWAGEFHAYNDDVFSCRVKVTQNLYLGSNEPYKDYIDLTLCLRKVNGKYMIYSLKNNG